MTWPAETESLYSLRIWSLRLNWLSFAFLGLNAKKSITSGRLGFLGNVMFIVVLGKGPFNSWQNVCRQFSKWVLEHLGRRREKCIEFFRPKSILFTSTLIEVRTFVFLECFWHQPSKQPEFEIFMTRQVMGLKRKECRVSQILAIEKISR